MSTKGSTWYDDPSEPMEWVAEAKPWCPSCCVRADQCGCPDGERLTDKHYATIDEAHLIRGED